MKYVFYHLNKSQHITPGYILVMHTYGRDLKWNPHIHMLITEGGLTKKGFNWRKVEHFHYELMRKTFQRILLNKLHEKLGNRFYKLKCKLYKKYDSGFYVHAPKRQFKSIEDGVKYLLRYTGKPVIAESRIMDLDLDNNNITYWYEDHKTGKRVEVTEHVYAFIAKIIRHIPEKNFKMVRYYGIYSNKNHVFRPYMDRMFTVQKIKEMKSNLEWRFSIISSFHIDPIKCECGSIMRKTYSYIPYKGGEYREIIYEKAKESQTSKRAFGANWEHFTKYSPQN
jgi:hypothetical protein